MSSLLEDPATCHDLFPAQRLRTTMPAVRVSLSWLGVRKTLTPEQKAQTAATFAAGLLRSTGGCAEPTCGVRKTLASHPPGVLRLG